MRVLAAKAEQFITDAQGKRTGVLLNLEIYRWPSAGDLSLTLYKPISFIGDYEEV